MSGINFTYRLVPLRLSRNDPLITVLVRVSNDTEEKKLLSMEAKVLTHGLLGFDRALNYKKAFKKIGELEPGASVEFSIKVYGSKQTKEGDYEILLTLYENFQDFDKVLSSRSKKCNIKVI